MENQVLTRLKRSLNIFLSLAYGPKSLSFVAPMSEGRLILPKLMRFAYTEDSCVTRVGGDLRSKRFAPSHMCSRGWPAMG